MPINYKAVKDTTKFLYSDLSEPAKIKARNEVISIEVEAYKIRLTTLKANIKKNINHCVNSNLLFRYQNLFTAKNFINRISDNETECGKFITGNFCNFLHDGTYVTYAENKSNMELIGKNTDFKAVWNYNKQYYTVYYKGKVLIDRKYKYCQIESYLN